jgi:hypothetical protein
MNSRSNNQTVRFLNLRTSDFLTCDVLIRLVNLYSLSEIFHKVVFLYFFVDINRKFSALYMNCNLFILFLFIIKKNVSFIIEYQGLHFELINNTLSSLLFLKASSLRKYYVLNFRILLN